MYYLKDNIYRYSLYLTLLAMAFSGTAVLYAKDDGGGRGRGDDGGGRGGRGGGGRGGGDGMKMNFRGGGDRGDRGGRGWKRDGGSRWGGGDHKRGRDNWRWGGRGHDRDNWKWKGKNRGYSFYFGPSYPYYYRNDTGNCYYDTYGRLICYDPYTGTYYYSR